MEAQPAAGGYPVQFDVAYPDRDLNRLTTFFRIFVAIPILIVAGALGGEHWNWGAHGAGYASAGGSVLFLPVLLMIVSHQCGYFWRKTIIRSAGRKSTPPAPTAIVPAWIPGLAEIVAATIAIGMTHKILNAVDSRSRSRSGYSTENSTG